MSEPTAETSPWIVETSLETFATDVLERSKETLVVVDFWAAWCQPCKMLAPLLEALAREYAGRFLLVKADTDQLPDIAGQFGVQSIPAVFAVREGQIADFFNGLLPEPQLRAWIDRLLPTPAETLVHEARALEATDRAAAEAKYRAALEADKDLAPAKIGLAGVLLAESPTPQQQDEAARLIEELAERGFLEPEAEKLRAALEVRQEGNAVGNVAACQAAVDADPGNFALQLDLARALAADHQYEPALAAALALVENDRHGLGEQGRVLMIDIFRLLPEDDELTSTYRRKLSTALY